MEKLFKVKRFLFETTADEAVCRFMLTDCFLPMLVPNQYIEMKSNLMLGKAVLTSCVYFSISCTRNSKLAIAYQCYLPVEKRDASFSYRVQIIQKEIWYA